jgi:hypothetical protein
MAEFSPIVLDSFNQITVERGKTGTLYSSKRTGIATLICYCKN